MQRGASPAKDWWIVGGGPHGVHLAVRLLSAGIAPEQIRILDPHDEPLAEWRGNTGNTGMSHLRSPQVHNLGLEALALEELARSSEFRASKVVDRRPEADAVPDFIPPYERPSLALFQHHARTVVETFGLMRLWTQGRAASIERTDGAYRITLQSGEAVTARNVVLALGSGDQLHWPDWAIDLKSREPRAPLDHIFSPGFRRETLDPSEDVVLVGAGISSVQLALSLAETAANRRITLLSRHSLRQADFESDPGWLGPLYLTEFDAETSLVERRAMIDEARQPGSLSADVMRDISRALRAGRVTHALAHVERATWTGSGRRIDLSVRPMELDEEAYHRTGEIVSRISDSAQPLAADRVVLGTGFDACRPGGAFVNSAIEGLDLPVAPDGFPVVDDHLRWCPGLFVMGPLAELVVGPASRNLSGARMAAQRIVESPEFSRSARSDRPCGVGRHPSEARAERV